MEAKDLVVLGITSGLVAGIIASIMDFITQLLSKKMDSRIESKKYINSLNDYRYKELSQRLYELLDHSSSFDDKTLLSFAEKGSLDISLYSKYDKELQTLYKKVNSLLNIDYREELENAADLLTHKHKAYLEEVVQESENANASASDYVIFIHKFEQVLIESIQKQLAELLLK